MNEGDRLENESLEGGLISFFSFVDVDRAARVSGTKAHADPIGDLWGLNPRLPPYLVLNGMAKAVPFQSCLY